MRDHKDDFAPFIDVADDVAADDAFVQYCDTVENSHDWGGQLEVSNCHFCAFVADRLCAVARIGVVAALRYRCTCRWCAATDDGRSGIASAQCVVSSKNVFVGRPLQFASSNN